MFKKKKRKKKPIYEKKKNTITVPSFSSKHWLLFRKEK